MTTKICTKCCNKYLAIRKFFYADKSHKDGLQSHCRKCHNKTTAKRRQKYPNYNKEYYQEHCEEMKEQCRVYRNSLVGFSRRLFYNMKQRCDNPNHINFSRYGGSNIKVLFGSFEEFFDCITNTLKVDPRGLEIHRINNNGHYEEGNIEFLMRAEHVVAHKEIRKLVRV